MQAMKVIKRIAYCLVRQVMTIDWVPWEAFMQMALSVLHTPWKNMFINY